MADAIIFLGSGGARIVVFKQIRASGGIWFSLQGTNLLVDPGPGSLVRIISSKHKLDPTQLDGILLSHSHLDHSGDVNIMIEALTTGGTKKRGVLFCPREAIEGEDPVVFKYLRSYLEKIVILQEKGEYEIKGVKFSCPIRHRHRGETYGFKFETERAKISYIADTKYFPELIPAYQADILIMNVVREKPSELDHLSLTDAKNLILGIRPKVAFLTHFGMTMIKNKPWILAEELTKETGIEVIAASDGMKYEL
ncbi:MAG: MBL fold metallo-hydrolase [candidate division WOR-3 bacterium]